MKIIKIRVCLFEKQVVWVNVAQVVRAKRHKGLRRHGEGFVNVNGLLTSDELFIKASDRELIAAMGDDVDEEGVTWVSMLN